MRKDYSDGRLKARDFFISLENVDSGNLEYKALYEILGLPAVSLEPASEAKISPTPSLVANLAETRAAIQRQASSEQIRQTFEKTDSVEFVVHQSHVPNGNVSTERVEAPAPTAKALVAFEENAAFFSLKDLWGKKWMKALVFVMVSGLLWAGLNEFYPNLLDFKPGPAPAAKMAPFEENVGRKEAEAARALGVNSAPRRNREAMPLRVPELSEKRIEKLPAPSAARASESPDTTLAPIENPNALENKIPSDGRSDGPFPTTMGNLPPEQEQGEFIPPPGTPGARTQPGGRARSMSEDMYDNYDEEPRGAENPRGEESDDNYGPNDGDL